MRYTIVLNDVCEWSLIIIFIIKYFKIYIYLRNFPVSITDAQGYNMAFSQMFSYESIYSKNLT